MFAADFKAAEDGPAIGLIADDAGKIFLANIPHVWSLEDTDGDLKADLREKIVSGFGVKTSLSGHDLHGLAWGPHDGKLYFSMGDRGYNITSKEGKVFKDTNSGAAFRCDPDGSNLELIYHNLRNPQEIAFNEFGDLFTVDNNCDQGDSARVCYLIEGGDAGWTLGTQALTTYSDFIEDGGMEQRPNWLEEGHWKTRFKGQPAFINPPIAHLTNGPSGMVFNSGTSTPERYKNHFLVCDYKGAPNVCFLYSFKVKQQGAGYVMDDAHVFTAACRTRTSTSVTMEKSTSPISAVVGNALTRATSTPCLTRKGSSARPSPRPRNLFTEGFPQDIDSLFGLLSHPDMRVRMRAQFNIAKQGEKNSLRLRKAALGGNLHAIWALRQIGAAGELRILAAAATKFPEMRAQAIRALGDLKHKSSDEIFRNAISAPSPRVRAFAAIASGKLRGHQAIPELIRLLASNDNADLNLRHAAVYGLEQSLVGEEQTQYIDHDSPAVRLGILLALRRQQNPLVAEFLDDEDPSLVAEAIRAINDLDIQEAVPTLADFAKKLTSDGHGKTPNLDEPLFRRVINANVRAGKPANAANLVALAANGKLPEAWRSLCLLALETFAAPQSIDPTLGVYRPLEKRDPVKIRAAIEAPLLALFKKASGDIAAGTTRIITTYNIGLDPKLLTRRILDSRQPEALRIAALQQLAANSEFSDKAVFRGALADSATDLRSTAARLWAKRFPAKRLEAVDALLSQTSDSDLRTAFDLLSTDKSPEAVQRLTTQLDSLKNGTLFRTVQLDLYEAIQTQADTALVAKLADIDPFQLTCEGGNPAQGQKVFENQGICLKCHTALRGGGDAGPPLGSIARLRRDDELLESLLDPNDKIVPGYGIATVTLNDGSSISGSPISQTKTHLVMKDPTGEKKEIPLTDIKARTPEISAMPPMFTTGILSKRDLRDVMAFPENSGIAKPAPQQTFSGATKSVAAATKFVAFSRLIIIYDNSGNFDFHLRLIVNTSKSIEKTNLPTFRSMLFKRFQRNTRPRIVAITVVRNEIDIVEAFVRHTATLVDHHIIVDHCSHDGTGEILKSLRAEGIELTLLSNDDPAYNQPVVTNVLMRKAFNEHAADWVLPLDGDEFILPPEDTDLHSALTNPPKHRGSLTYAFRTYHPHPADDSTELNAAKRIGHHYVNETGEFHKILVHRSVAKHEDLHIRPGNHHLNIGDFLIPPVELPGFELAHFPVRSLGQYIRKISMGELGKDAFGKKRKGLGTQKTAPFEQLKHNAEHFFNHALTPDRELALQPIVYRGSELRYTAPEDEIADTIQGILTMAHDIALQLGKLRDKTREKGVNPLFDTSSVKLNTLDGEPPIRPSAFEAAKQRTVARPTRYSKSDPEVFLSK